jgi:hypothetical protein
VRATGTCFHLMGPIFILWGLHFHLIGHHFHFKRSPTQQRPPQCGVNAYRENGRQQNKAVGAPLLANRENERPHEVKTATDMYRISRNCRLDFTWLTLVAISSTVRATGLEPRRECRRAMLNAFSAPAADGPGRHPARSCLRRRLRFLLPLNSARPHSAPWASRKWSGR